MKSIYPNLEKVPNGDWKIPLPDGNTLSVQDCSSDPSLVICLSSAPQNIEGWAMFGQLIHKFFINHVENGEKIEVCLNPDGNKLGNMLLLKAISTEQKIA